MFGSPQERALRRLMRRYQAAVLANPRDLDTRLKLAHTFQMLGRQRDAAEELTIVAKVTARAGASLEALSTLQAILAIDPKHTETQRLLSSLYARPQPEEVPSAARVARPIIEEDDDGEATSPAIPTERVFPLTTPAQAQSALEGELVEVVLDAEATLEEDDDDDAPSEVSEVDILASVPGGPAGRGHLPLFSALAPDAFESLITHLRTAHYPAGAQIFEEGDSGDSVMLLVSGRVRIEKGAKAGRPTHLATLEPGAFFGEFGYLTDRRRHARCVAETPVEVLEATREVIESTTNAHPEIRDTLLEFYGRRLVETMSLFSPLLRLLKPQARTRWLERFGRRSFATGESILEEGTRGEGLFVILRGDADVDKRKKDGTAVRVATLHEGDFFGEASLLTGRPVMASIRARTAVEALRLPPRDFADLLGEAPEIRHMLQESAVERKLYTESLVAGRATGSSQQGGPVLL